MQNILVTYLEKKYLWWSWKLLLSSVSTFLKWFLNIHFSSQCIWRMSFTIFHEILLSKPVRRKFSIVKVFLKNLAKLTESYICWCLFFNKVKGWNMKGNSGSGAFLWIFIFCEIFKNNNLVVYMWTANSDNLGYPYREIFYKIHIEEMQFSPSFW